MCSEGLLEKMGYGVYRAAKHKAHEKAQPADWEERATAATSCWGQLVAEKPQAVKRKS
jgi:hypothetical protein